MGIFNFLMHRSMKKEAKRFADLVSAKYPESKAKLGDASQQDIILGMAFDRDRLENLAEASRKRIKTCCKTLNGFCYMMSLDSGMLKGLPNFRSLQFTVYMDKELEACGLPKQTYEQKKEILEAMELAIDGWEKLTNNIH